MAKVPRALNRLDSSFCPRERGHQRRERSRADRYAAAVNVKSKLSGIPNRPAKPGNDVEGLPAPDLKRRTRTPDFPPREVARPTMTASFFPPSGTGSRWLHRSRLLRVLPGCLGQRHGSFCGLDGCCVRRGTVSDTSGDTLRDPREPEQVIGKIPVQVGDSAAGDIAID